MSKLLQLFKKGTDFSTSSTKPLFWILLGPVLLLLTVMIPNPFSRLLPLIAIGGLLISWRWRLNGFALSLMTFLIAFSIPLFFGTGGDLLWKWGYGCSMILSLTVAFLSMEEVKSHYETLKEDENETLLKLKQALQSLNEKSGIERRGLENECEALTTRIAKTQEDVDDLVHLVDASHVEAEKAYKQNEHLSAESLVHHREIVSLRQSLEESQDQLSVIKASHAEKEVSVKALLKRLNNYRVELYQSRTLVDGYLAKLKVARKLFLQGSEKKKVEAKPKAQRGQFLVLETLEKDKATIRGIYDQLLAEYKALEKTDSTDGKKKKLEQTKAELISIEREIFSIKKGMQQTGAFT